jgi:hypothetical protein
MSSTEAILTSDHPGRESLRQHFNEKPHPDSGERSFQLLTGDIMPFTCPEKVSFSNDASPGIQKDGLEDIPGVPGPVFWERDPDSPAGRRRGSRSEMSSTEAILTSDHPGRESLRQHFNEKPHPDSGERSFQPLTGDIMPFTCPEKVSFSNDASPGVQKDGLEDVPGTGRGFSPGSRSLPGPIGKNVNITRAREISEEMNP